MSPEEKKGGVISLAIDDKGAYKILNLLERVYVEVSPVGCPVVVMKNPFSQSLDQKEIRSNAPTNAEAYVLGKEHEHERDYVIGQVHIPIQYYRINRTGTKAKNSVKK